MTEQITAYADGLNLSRNALLSHRMLRQTFLKRIESLSVGAVTLHEQEYGTTTLGPDANSDEAIHVHIHDQAFYQHACLGGAVGLGEAYMLGLWHCDELVDLVRLFIRNLDQLDAMDAGLASLQKPFLKLLDWRRRNHKDNSRLNIAAHYDLGNDFFQLFLDESMMYSSAIFQNTQQGLKEAQQNKLGIICNKLDLKPGEHLLEIGTGWGAMAIYAARHYGVKVTTTTISEQQYELAVQRIAEAGLSDRITVLLKDYRDLEGQYDKLVSIEMIEAVGHDFLPGYLQTCERLLRPDGRALLQAITCKDQRYDQYRKSPDFIRRYIFPGGHLPSVTMLLGLTTANTGLRLSHMEDFAADYAQTLSIWRQKFWAQESKVRNLGYSEVFMRMWDFYLATCEAGFAERHIGVTHLVLDAPAARHRRITSG